MKRFPILLEIQTNDNKFPLEIQINYKFHTVLKKLTNMKRLKRISFSSFTLNEIVTCE